MQGFMPLLYSGVDWYLPYEVTKASHRVRKKGTVPQPDIQTQRVVVESRAVAHALEFQMPVKPLVDTRDHVCYHSPAKPVLLLGASVRRIQGLDSQRVWRL